MSSCVETLTLSVNLSGIYNLLAPHGSFEVKFVWRTLRYPNEERSVIPMRTVDVYAADPSFEILRCHGSDAGWRLEDGAQSSSYVVDRSTNFESSKLWKVSSPSFSR